MEQVGKSRKELEKRAFIKRSRCMNRFLSLSLEVTHKTTTEAWRNPLGLVYGKISLMSDIVCRKHSVSIMSMMVDLRAVHVCSRTVYPDNAAASNETAWKRQCWSIVLRGRLQYKRPKRTSQGTGLWRREEGGWVVACLSVSRLPPASLEMTVTPCDA